MIVEALSNASKPHDQVLLLLSHGQDKRGNSMTKGNYMSL
jgi:hypothetical protein